MGCGMLHSLAMHCSQNNWPKILHNNDFAEYDDDHDVDIITAGILTATTSPTDASNAQCLDQIKAPAGRSFPRGATAPNTSMMLNMHIRL